MCEGKTAHLHFSAVRFSDCVNATSRVMDSEFSRTFQKRRYAACWRSRVQREEPDFWSGERRRESELKEMNHLPSRGFKRAPPRFTADRQGKCHRCTVATLGHKEGLSICQMPR